MPINELKRMKDRYDALNKALKRRVEENSRLKKENKDLKNDLELCKNLIAKLSKTITDMVPGKEIPEVAEVLVTERKRYPQVTVPDEIVERLCDAFPGSFINREGEFIAHEEVNSYFILKGCETELGVKCKVLEWLSRDAYKTEPFYTEAENEEFHEFMLGGINAFLGTSFDDDDIEPIYVELGNCVDHVKTIRFINSGYDMNVLLEKDADVER